MYGFNNCKPFPFTNGRLQIIEIGKYQTFLTFDNGWRIQVMNRCSVLRNGSEFTSYNNQTGWQSTNFQTLIELELNKIEIISDDMLTMYFEGGFEIHLFDDVKMYESLMITGPNNQCIIV